MSEIIDGWNKKYEPEVKKNVMVSNAPARPIVSNLNGNSNNIGYGVSGYGVSVYRGMGFLDYNGFATSAAPQTYTLGSIYRQAGER